jgi:hypothetical protein
VCTRLEAVDTVRVQNILGQHCRNHASSPCFSLLLVISMVIVCLRKKLVRLTLHGLGLSICFSVVLQNGKDNMQSR